MAYVMHRGNENERPDALGLGVFEFGKKNKYVQKVPSDAKNSAISNGSYNKVEEIITLWALHWEQFESKIIVLKSAEK